MAAVSAGVGLGEDDPAHVPRPDRKKSPQPEILGEDRLRATKMGLTLAHTTPTSAWTAISINPA